MVGAHGDVEALSAQASLSIPYLRIKSSRPPTADRQAMTYYLQLEVGHKPVDRIAVANDVILSALPRQRVSPLALRPLTLFTKPELASEPVSFTCFNRPCRSEGRNCLSRLSATSTV